MAGNLDPRFMKWALSKGLNPGDAQVRKAWDSEQSGGGTPGKRGRKKGTKSTYLALAIGAEGEILSSLPFEAASARSAEVPTTIGTLHQHNPTSVLFRVLGPAMTAVDSSGAEISVYRGVAYSFDMRDGAETIADEDSEAAE